MSDLRLNAHEKAAISNAARNYDNDPAALWEAVHAAIDPREQAAARRALEDAADAVARVRDRGLPPACHSHPTHPYIENWLRDRAASRHP